MTRLVKHIATEVFNIRALLHTPTLVGQARELVVTHGWFWHKIGTFMERRCLSFWL